jgi:exodeoxyribonuclease VII large subunit
LYASRLQPAGKGQLYAQFEALKERLRLAGFFDEVRKRPLSPLPARIGVVTSADAAALRDILRTLAAHWPLVDVMVFPTLVQGADAPPRIVAAIEAANRYSVEVAPINTLIVARGGGSIEDLWAFNDERVAVAVAASAIPVISGVGHETDFTIVDFVADVRSPTPTAAAAIAVQARADHHARMMARVQNAEQRLMQRIGQERRLYDRLDARLHRIHPQRQLDQQLLRLDERERRLNLAANRGLARRGERRLAAEQRLELLNPLRVLGRGYSIVQRMDGVVVIAPEMVSEGERLDVRSAGGAYRVEVRQEN